MYMNYKRLFLNWIKQRDPRNTFENCLRRNNRTLKSHVKEAPLYDHLIIFNSFSWLNTIEGFEYWGKLYINWLEFYTKWAKKHQKSRSYEL